ncbi:hypothetical protein OAA87_02530 [Amylibacter sp.]|nr:hypothetical protein [Amylibacter sp.]
MSKSPNIKVDSDSNLTKYIDGEITDQDELEAFKQALSMNADLQARTNEMINIKSQILSIVDTQGLKISKFVKEEIHRIIENSNLDTEQTVSENEILISRHVDGELDDREIIEVEKLISKNKSYQKLYESLKVSKVDITNIVSDENYSPSGFVKDEIDNLINSSTADNAKNVVLQTSNVIRISKKNIFRNIGNLGQKLAPLAAVFVLGIGVSPFFNSTNDEIFQGAEINLRGVNTVGIPNVKESSEFISVIQNEKLLFKLQLISPFEGEMKIYMNSSVDDDKIDLDRSKNFYEIGTVKPGNFIEFPNNQILSFDETDKLLRVDVEVKGKNKTFNYTEFLNIKNQMISQ